jgi:hypothetical protein
MDHTLDLVLLMTANSAQSMTGFWQITFTSEEDLQNQTGRDRRKTTKSKEKEEEKGLL